MNSSVIRQEFLDFFEKKGHKIVPSSSLIPTDPSVLFTTAGMQQFKNYFLGEKSPYGNKVISCQKCLRTSDIDEVGDESHLTFFEMLGNFSFSVPAVATGEGGATYFKKETIELAIEFLTKHCKLSIDKLWFTFFKGDLKTPADNDSKRILLSSGVPKEKITGFGRESNFWGPTGQEGPCGPTTEIHFDLTGKPCQLGKKCLPNCGCGRFIELWNLVFNEYYQDKEKKLSPLKQNGVDTGLGLERLVAAQNKKTIFETDLFEPLIETIEKNSQVRYQEFPEEMRIIADHMKAVVFLIGEGILPEKIGRGYIVRRLLRRIIREKMIIQANDNILIETAKKIIDIYHNLYPEVLSKETDILTVIKKEEENFSRTLEEGIKQLNKFLERQEGKKIIGGKEAFSIFETYGFPLELIQEISKEKGFKVDLIGFHRAFDRHQEISRAGVEKKFGGLGKAAESEEAVKLHTATHLLHAVLRQILGSEVRQMGSDINPERLRFDFSFARKLTENEIKEAENLVNLKIKGDLEIIKEEMPLVKALASGALSFFKEKYPEIVTVYSIKDSSGQVFSKEVCAGPHVERTGAMGQFKIIKEESVGAGIRRIKAILIPKPHLR